MKPPVYQKELSQSSPILLDRDYKRPKVEKMLAVLQESGVLPTLPQGVVLDVGCSRGFFIAGLAPYFVQAIGLDIDTGALALARMENTQENLLLVQGDSMALPLADSSVDLILCNHVYEHVPSASQLFREIFRVLRSGGACYLGAATWYSIIEPHYHLPFLSWLPKPLAHRYMRLFGKGDYYYENLLSFWGIRRLTSAFLVTDYSIPVIMEPDLFRARDLIPQGSMMTRIPRKFWKAFYWAFPSYILVLKKPS